MSEEFPPPTMEEFDLGLGRQPVLGLPSHGELFCVWIVCDVVLKRCRINDLRSVILLCVAVWLGFYRSAQKLKPFFLIHFSFSRAVSLLV